MQEKMKINYAGACIAQYDRFIGLFITLSNDRLLIVLLSCTYCRRLNVPCILKENINHLSNIDGTIQNAGYTFLEKLSYGHLHIFSNEIIFAKCLRIIFLIIENRTLVLEDILNIELLCEK